MSDTNMRELDLITAAMNLAGATNAHAAILPIPETTPQLYVAFGEAQQLREYADDLPQSGAALSQPIQSAEAVSDSMLKWALRELLGALPERRDWLNPDAEKVLRAALASGPAAEPVAAIPEATALSETQLYRLGYGQGVRRAAALCDAKYQARVESGHPREASTARALTEDIRNLQSVSLPAIPEAPQEQAKPTEARELTEGEFMDVIDASEIAKEGYDYISLTKLCRMAIERHLATTKEA